MLPSSQFSNEREPLSSGSNDVNTISSASSAETEDDRVPEIAPTRELTLQALDTEPPPYDASQQLIATTPALSRRYEKKPLVEYPSHREIPTGLFSVTPASIPPPPAGWLEFVHPEGQNYFYNPTRRITTEANLRTFVILQRILQAAGLIDALIAAQNIVLPTSTELLLELGDDDLDGTTTRYYLVDHIRRTVFWLENTATDRLDLPPVTSMMHMKHLMQQHYWNHVEFYPMHIALPVSVEEELIAILSHACIDFMTSDLSTVPYNQEQCETFIKIVTGIPDSRRIDGYRNAVMARLWSEIAGNYFVNLHGEPSARLSRNQRLLPLPDVKTTGMITVVKKALLNAPDRYYDTLCELWVDKISYAAHWRLFMLATVKDWRNTSLWALLLLVSSFGIFGVSLALQTPSPFLISTVQSASLVSVLFCLISISSGLVLTRTYNHHADAHASEAVDFLENACHETYGLQPLAITFALPWASFVWAFIFFSICVLLLSFSIDFLAFKIFIWAALSISLIAGYVVLLFLRNGAASLSASRLRATLPVSDRTVEITMAPVRLVERMTSQITMVPVRLVERMTSQFFRVVRRLRHGGRRRNGEHSHVYTPLSPEPPPP